MIRFREKGGKETEIPVHHKLDELLDQYLEKSGLRNRPTAPLFPIAVGKRESSGTARQPESMQPECSNAGSKTPGCRMHSLPILLGLPESRISWRMEERWRWPSGLPVMPIVGRPNFTTDVGRGFYSKTWSGFDTDFKTVPESTASIGETKLCQPFETKSL